MNKQKLSIVIVLVLLFSLMYIGVTRSKSKRIEHVIVDISQEQQSYFVREADVMQAVKKQLGRPAEGLKANEIDLSKIENIVKTNPWVRNAEVHTSYSGELKIEIVPRMPLVRIEPTSGKPYYLDLQAEPFPLSNKFTAHVPVAIGDIDSIVSRKVYTLMRYVNESPFWKGQVQQIFVESENNLFIVPTVGSHIIEIGEVENLDVKFRNLLAFYKEVLPKTGWNTYREISIRYKGQVIGRKP